MTPVHLLRSIAIAGAVIAAAGCASRTPAADRIVYESVTYVGPDPGIGAEAPSAQRGGQVRHAGHAGHADIPESARREWFEKHGPNRGYTPARGVDTSDPQVREVIRERRVYVDRGYECDDHRWVGALAPVAFAVGWRHGNRHHHHNGLRYGLAYSFPFWWW